MGFRALWLFWTRVRFACFPIGASAILVARLAFAQDVGKPPSTAVAPESAAPATASTVGASAESTTTTVPAPTASAAPSSVGPTMGYAYGDPKHSSDRTAHPRAHTRAHHVSGPVATLPGFLLLPAGGSRLFVELTANVSVVEKPIAGGITYVIKGAHVVKRNNENALVTVHFNTPVTRARLIPAGGDLHFVVDLRQNVKATWKLVPAKDGATVLQIDFPGGNYLPNDADDSTRAVDGADKSKSAGSAKNSGAKN